MPRLRDHHALSRVSRDGPEFIAVDTETTGLGWADDAFCATLAWRDSEGQLHSAFLDLEEGHTPGDLRRILERVPVWIFHHAKFDLQKLILAGIITADVAQHWEHEDTQTIQHLLNENERKGLKVLAAKYLREETDEAKVLAKVRRKLGLKKEDGYYHIPRRYIRPYAIKDAEFTLRLFEILRPKLDKLGAKDPAVLALYATERELTRTLLTMEAYGFALDVDYLREKHAEYSRRVMEGQVLIQELAEDQDINPNAPAQLRKAFERRGLYLESTDVATLQPLVEADELAAAVLQYRTDKKIHTTYLTAMLAEQRDGVLHPHFNATGARTGRMSSGTASNN